MRFFIPLSFCMWALSPESLPSTTTTYNCQDHRQARAPFSLLVLVLSVFRWRSQPGGERVRSTGQPTSRFWLAARSAAINPLKLIRPWPPKVGGGPAYPRIQSCSPCPPTRRKSNPNNEQIKSSTTFQFWNLKAPPHAADPNIKKCERSSL